VYRPKTGDLKFMKTSEDIFWVVLISHPTLDSVVSKYRYFKIVKIIWYFVNSSCG